MREQCRYEVGAWLRTLDYIQQENIYMKNLIAATIKTKNNPEILDRVEYYLNTFLNKEAVVAFLRKDIKQFADMSNGNGLLIQRQRDLRKDMERMEKEFSHLKTEFNSYMQDII